MMRLSERRIVSLVAKSVPWLAPAPSAYFVARSAMKHLGVPVVVAIAMAAIIEALGLATVYTALQMYDWNGKKRKSDPRAPWWLAGALTGVYVLATLGLVVFLEVWPALSIYAPALFPALAVVGTVNLVLIAQQEGREAAVNQERAERKAGRSIGRPAGRTGGRTGGRSNARDGGSSPDGQMASSLATANAVRTGNRTARLRSLATVVEQEPDAGPAAWARALGMSRTTVYSYLQELEREGLIVRGNDGNGHGRT